MVNVFFKTRKKFVTFQTKRQEQLDLVVGVRSNCPSYLLFLGLFYFYFFYFYFGWNRLRSCASLQVEYRCGDELWGVYLSFPFTEEGPVYREALEHLSLAFRGSKQFLSWLPMEYLRVPSRFRKLPTNGPYPRYFNL